MKHKSKIIGIAGLVLMANLMFVPFVLAQQLGSVVCSVTTAPPGLADPTSSEQACRDAGGTPGQAPGADVVNTPKITKASWEAAQKDQAACLKFKDDLYNVSKHAFKATWYDKGPQYQSSSAQAQYGNWGVEVNNSIGGQTTGTRCYVVSAWEADWGKDNANVRTTVSKTLETTIKQSEAGIAAEDFAEWQRKDNMEKTAAGPISALVGAVLDALLSVVAAFLGVLASIAGEIFSYAVAQATDVMVLPSAVTIGWGIMRDISNMFFILIMIIIALAAILRVEEYDYRHLLGKVVIIAILVNFSQVIALTIINFVNFLTAVFWSNVGFTDIFATMMRVANPANAILEGYRGGWSGALVSGLSKNLFMLVSLVVFLALAAMFIIRLVGLYVLVICSPIAYVAHILPSTKKFGHEWWEKFIKYLIWAPESLFMLRLSFVIVQDPKFKGSDSAFTYIILTAFLAAAVLVAEEAGMVGGSMVVHGVEKGAKFVGGRALGFAGKKWNERTAHLLEAHGEHPVPTWKKAAFAVLNPVATLKGYEQRATETKHMAQELAAAGGREVAEQFLTGGWRGKAKLKIPYRQFAERKEEDGFLKEYGQMKKESLMRAAVTSEGLTGTEGEARKRAIIKAAASGGYLDDILRMKHFANKYADKDGTTYSAGVLNRFLYGYLGDGEQAQRFMAEDMEELGKKVKHFEYLGHAYYDPDAETFKRGMNKVGEETFIRGGVEQKIETLGQGTDRSAADFNHQASYAAGEFAKLGGRDRVNIAPHNLTVIRSNLTMGTNDFAKPGEELGEDKYYKDDGSMDVSQRLILEKLDADVAREAQHAQERVKERVLTSDFDKTTEEVVIKSTGEFNKIQALYKANKEYVVGMYFKELGKDPRNNLEAALSNHALYNIKYRLEDGAGNLISRSEFTPANTGAPLGPLRPPPPPRGGRQAPAPAPAPAPAGEPRFTPGTILGPDGRPMN